MNKNMNRNRKKVYRKGETESKKMVSLKKITFFFITSEFVVDFFNSICDLLKNLLELLLLF